MATPTTTDEFVKLLLQSNLLRAEQFLEFLVVPKDTQRPQKVVAQQLVRERLLTPFQADQLLKGHFKGFFLTDKYKILDRIGEGGMGRVLLCEHLMLQRLVAVKILNLRGAEAPPGTEERFLREARAAALLNHPNIVRVTDADYSSYGPFMVMEYVDGTNLHQVVAEHGALTPARAANYIYQASLGLIHAHSEGLIHRDIKPGNLLLDRQGVVKILDLGLARFRDDGKNESLTRKFDARNVLGTADFIAPEQTLNSSQVDIRADIYSLGCTLFYMLTRRLPFEEGSLSQKLLWHQSRPLPKVQEFGIEIPEALNEILLKMTQKDPADRYQTPQEVCAALLEWKQYDQPPPPQEMPRVPASYFRVGLCAPAVGLSGSGQTPNPPSATMTSSTSAGETGRSAQRIPSPTMMQATEEFDTIHHTVNPPPCPPDSDSIEATALNIPIQGGLMDESQLGSARSEKSTGSRALKVLAPITPAIPEKVSRRWLFLAMALTGIVGLGIGAVIFHLLRPAQNLTAVSTSIPTSSSSSPMNAAPVKLTISGSGSTLIQPLMELWAEEFFQDTGIKVDYDPKGSTIGIQQAYQRNKAFGMTEAPLTENDLKQSDSFNNNQHGKLVSIPLVASAVVIGYNLPILKEAGQPLVLDRYILLDIFSGDLKRWSDPRILKLNPILEKQPPDMPIRVVRRLGGSGSSYLLTSYFAAISDSWRKQERFASPTPNWPPNLTNTTDANGSDGVINAIRESAGTIGYVELSQAVQSNLPFAKLKKSSIEAVSPSMDSISIAAKSFRYPVSDLNNVSLVNSEEKGAYPICGVTWAVLLEKGEPKLQREATLKFLRWILEKGQPKDPKTYFAPLPEGLRKQCLAEVERLENLP